MVRYDKKVLAIGIAIIGLFILGITGLTYAFFTAGVEGNPNATETIVETADLRLFFNDTEIITLDNALPGESTTKTFTISNIGNRKVNYDINIIDVVNTFINDELVYSFTSTNGGAEVTEEALPDTNGTLVSGSIEPGVTQVYTMTILFKENGTNQNENQSAEFAGKLQINASELISDDVEFSIEETIGNVAIGETKTISILGQYYGKLSCESEDTNIAECTPSQNEINILGKSSGTTDIIVTEDNKNLEITYTLTVKQPTIYEKIISNNVAQSDELINFSSTTENGFYYIADEETYGEDGERIYYFRGNVNNNWVSFAGYLWRIVRTTSEEGIKLIYSGDGEGTSSGFINTNIRFNMNRNNKYYVGYTYNTTGYINPSQTDSKIKEIIDEWYDSVNGVKAYEDYLSPTAIYCNDRSSERVDGTTIYYPSRDRLMVNLHPSYDCLSSNASRYTVSIEKGNGYLQNPIALLSADEIEFSGVGYIKENATDYSWYTMSPFMWHQSTDAWQYYVTTSGGTTTGYVNNLFAVRPAIAFKSCVSFLEGDGTKTIPYQVSNSSC